MKILALAFIMALMVAMIGADSSSSEEKHRFYRGRYGYIMPKGALAAAKNTQDVGGYPYRPYPQPYPQPYPYPYHPFGRK